MLVDSRTSPLNTTSLSTLVSSGQRVVILAADYAEFTGSDPLALDSCTSLDNQLGANLEDPQRAYNDEVELFAGAAAERAKHKAANMYWLRSLAMSGGPSQIENAAKLRFHAYITSGQKQKIISECSKNYGLPNVTTFCPCVSTSLDCSIDGRLDEWAHGCLGGGIDECIVTHSTQCSIPA